MGNRRENATWNQGNMYPAPGGPHSQGNDVKQIFHIRQHFTQVTMYFGFQTLAFLKSLTGSTSFKVALKSNRDLCPLQRVFAP